MVPYRAEDEEELDKQCMGEILNAIKSGRIPESDLMDSYRKWALQANYPVLIRKEIENRLDKKFTAYVFTKNFILDVVYSDKIPPNTVMLVSPNDYTAIKNIGGR